jgi:hypothetical protein
MSNEDGSFWIVCNGESFNQPNLRQDLIRLGGDVWFLAPGCEIMAGCILQNLD